MCLQCRSELGSFCVGNRDQVLDAHGVEDLAAEPLRDHAGGDPLAGCVDGRRGARGTAAHDEHVEWIERVDPLGLPVGCTGVESGEDLLEGHPTLVEELTVEQHRRYGQHVVALHLLLEEGAVDRHVGDVGIENAHGVEGLHHVGAVLARQRHVGDELEVPLELLHCPGRVLGDRRRVSTHLQQGEDQRRELMTHRNPREAHSHVASDPHDRERGCPAVLGGLGADR